MILTEVLSITDQLNSDFIFLIVGESGAGKDTVVDQVVTMYGAKRLDSYTTRPQRNRFDKHYFVDSYEDWCLKNPTEEVVGYTNFNGHQYWATRSQVDASNLYIIDPDGIKWFRERYTGKKKCRIVYIESTVGERMRRMYRRGDGIAGAVRRLLHDRHRFAGVRSMADYVIHNYSAHDSAESLWRYMRLMDGI